MKKIMVKTAMAALLAGALCNSCIEESFPNDNTLTSEQLADMPVAFSGLLNAVAGHAGMAETYSAVDYDLGYLGLSIIRDSYCEDFPPYDPSYNWFLYWASNSYLGGNYSTAEYPWKYYYKWAAKTNLVLRNKMTEANKLYFGMAYFYRAMIYFDLARTYEYKRTGISELDQQATDNDIWGKTVPVITESSTEAEARNTPRLMFYDMYRFLLDDLSKAEEYLADYTDAQRGLHNLPDISVVYGELARIYLEIGTRFELAPSDLTTYRASGVDLGVSSSKEAYALAASYARKAINKTRTRVLGEDEWFGGSSYANGFNDASNWMLGAIISKEMLSTSSWRNFIGYVSPEQYFGYAGISYDGALHSNNYACQRLISTALYAQINDTDWRKKTWIDPADAGKPNNGKYKTNIADAHFQILPPLTGFKFRPKGGEKADYAIGAAADFPLMRVEEMYLIEAEALASSESLASGIAALENFVHTRDAAYTCTASDLDAFREQLMIQKRIEFWGEGIVAWDYKRLMLGITRGYEGTNFPSSYRLNSQLWQCAPWLNGFIPLKEVGMNQAIKANPDPSGMVELWKE